MSAVSAPDCPVVIAGGGLIGLSAAMFLAQQGIASLVVERLRGGSPLPRAAHFHLRTLELFRLAGIEEEVKRRSEDDFLPEGAGVHILGDRRDAVIIFARRCDDMAFEHLCPSLAGALAQDRFETRLTDKETSAGAQRFDPRVEAANDVGELAAR